MAAPARWIDAGETPLQAAYRELQEETGIERESVQLIYELPYWLCYDLPPEAIGRALKGIYKGQKQKWFAMRYAGDGHDINLEAHSQREFETWQWRRWLNARRLLRHLKNRFIWKFLTGFTLLCLNKSCSPNQICTLYRLLTYRHLLMATPRTSNLLRSKRMMRCAIMGFFLFGTTRAQ